MRLYRFEFGKWSFLQQTEWKDYFEVSYDKGCCDCHLFSLSLFYFTILGNECYTRIIEEEKFK